jgi:hypothetical protein
MLKFSERTKSWNQMMLSPSKTAAIHAKKKGLGFRDGLENFGTPLLMTYLPMLLITMAVSGNIEPLLLAAVLFSLAATALGIFAVSVAFAFMAHFVASFLGGKADLGRLYYMSSLAAAPTFVFTIAINICMLLLKAMVDASLLPLGAAKLFQLAGNLVAVSVTLYGFYLMTVAIDSLYRFGRAKSVATWLAPTVVLMLVGATLFIADLFGILRFLVKTLW